MRATSLRLWIETRSIEALSMELRNFSTNLTNSGRLYSAIWTIEAAFRLALVSNNNHAVAHSYRLILSRSVDIGHWERVETVYRAFNPTNLESRNEQ